MWKIGKIKIFFWLTLSHLLFSSFQLEQESRKQINYWMESVVISKSVCEKTENKQSRITDEQTKFTGQPDLTPMSTLYIVLKSMMSTFRKYFESRSEGAD